MVEVISTLTFELGFKFNIVRNYIGFISNFGYF